MVSVTDALTFVFLSCYSPIAFSKMRNLASEMRNAKHGKSVRNDAECGRSEKTTGHRLEYMGRI